MSEDHVIRRPMKRRTVLAAGAAAAGTAAIAGATPAEAAAPAVTGPFTTDTMNGLISFVMPGSDAYSRHQGEYTTAPGGVASGNAKFIIRTFDEALPFPFLPPQLDIELPGALAIGALLNLYALRVNPLAAVGPFLTPFPRLRFAQKANVFKLLDADPIFVGTPIKFMVNALPTLAAFVAFSEASRLDPRTKQLTSRPVGWDLTSYPGVSDGWDEFLGYYRGVSEAEG